MLRIGEFIQSIDVTAGGTSTAFLNTLAALATRPTGELSVHAYCSPPVAGDTAWAQIDRLGRDRFTLVSGYGRGVGPGNLGRAVVADIEAGRVDLLHIHGLWSPDLMAAGLACRRRGVPYLWQPHGMLVREAYAQKRWKKDLFMALGMHRALGGAAGLVFVTREERDHSLISRAIGPGRRHVVPLPVQMPDIAGAGEGEFRRRARERFAIPAADPCVVFMGRLHPVKRIEMIIDAAAAIARDLPDLNVLLVGGGDDAYVQSLRARAADAGLDGRIHFAGWVKGEDKWLALGAGDALTLNSVHENFGFVAPEALCVGTMPVLTRNLALAAEMAEGGVAEVAEAEAASLGAAWRRAIESNRADSVLSRGRAWVQSHLSVEAIGAQLTQIFTRAAAGSATPAG